MALSKDDIFGADDIKTETVPVPQWGGDVRLRMLDGVEREELEKRIQAFKTNSRASGKSAVRAVSVVMSAVTDDGHQLFSEEDTEKLARKSGAALDLLFEHILSMNGMSKKEADDLAKN